MKSKDELLKIAKPILFNTEMVRAILDGRKTVTRRCIKLKYSNTHHEMRTDKYGTRLIEIENEVPGVTRGKHEDGSSWVKMRGYIEPKAPYKRGDILYVRETWLKTDCFGLQDGYFYKANETPNSKQVREEYGFKWRPSIHMPKEAARIFLRVTDVRAERLQDIMKDPPGPKNQIVREGCKYGCDFIAEWENTIPKANRSQYGWDANPWVWVVEFERVVPDELQ